MKLIILLALCMYATSTVPELTFSELIQIWQRFLLKHIDECVKNSGVNRVLAERLLPYGEYVDDPGLKCFVRCIAGNLHMVETNAEAHHQHFLDILNIHNPIIRRDVIRQCFEQIENEDACSQVFYTSECVYFVVKKALTGKGKPPASDKNKIDL